MAAAALHPGWKLCRGIEILEGIHNVAMENVNKCPPSSSSSALEHDKMEESRAHTPRLPLRGDLSNNDGVASPIPSPKGKENEQATIENTIRLPMAPLEMIRGSFDDPYQYFADA